MVTFITKSYDNYAGYFALLLISLQTLRIIGQKKRVAFHRKLQGNSTNAAPWKCVKNVYACVTFLREWHRSIVGAFSFFSLTAIFTERSSLFSLLDAQVGYNRDPTASSVSRGTESPQFLRI